MKFAESGDFDSARANDAEARAKHWDDWMVFSVVMGPNARKVVQSESLMGSVIVAVDDCVGQQNCRFDQFKTSAELLWANLPLACQQDFWGAI